MPKVKPVASGVDLSNLSAAQLKALAVEARVKAIELSEKERKAAVNALKVSGELDALKKEWVALGNEGHRLTKKVTFNITLPIQFTMTTDGPYALSGEDNNDVFSYVELTQEVTEDDLFTHDFTAKLLKGHDLSKKQAVAFNAAVADYAMGACSDIYEIMPEDVRSQYQAFAAKVEAFVIKAGDAGLTLKDLDPKLKK